MSFLKAEWRKLAFANYEIPPSVLSKYVPPGTELDLWDGKCFVSLIGFMFLNTKIFGVKIPFHAAVEEVNLRFYVKRFENNTWKRGAVMDTESIQWNGAHYRKSHLQRNRPLYCVETNILGIISK